jgi:DNA (cytosine-5)-methyltransferase 1
MDIATTLLSQARARYTQRQLAEQLNVSQRTVARRENGETPCPTMLAPALKDLLGLRPDTANQDFTFIDLFAGIGGIRKGFEAHGGRCVLTSEWNSYAQKTYLANFPDDQGDVHTFVGDIQPFPATEVPDHDVLLGGFPCQPFSIAGVSKKNSLGRLHGF